MKICVVGAGYVGLTLSVALASFGHDMICTDKDLKKIEQLEKWRHSLLRAWAFRCTTSLRQSLVFF